MFELGLTLQPQDFLFVSRRPRAVAVGLCGQLILLPAIAFVLGYAFSLPPYLFIGMMLVACCPGGSSSNIFSMLAKGDVALSVSLTALSSIITLGTVPVIMHYTTILAGTAAGVRLPMGSLLLQNLITMLVPIALGILVRRYHPITAKRLDSILSRLAFPALMLLALIFFYQHKGTIADNIASLGLCTTLLIVIATAMAYGIAKANRLNVKERRTIVIEVGMQNAAQAIAIASSPFVFNNGEIAIPAIVYALLMNMLLLPYAALIKYGRVTARSF